MSPQLTLITPELWKVTAAEEMTDQLYSLWHKGVTARKLAKTPGYHSYYNQNTHLHIYAWYLYVLSKMSRRFPFKPGSSATILCRENLVGKWTHKKVKRRPPRTWNLAEKHCSLPWWKDISLKYEYSEKLSDGYECESKRTPKSNKKVL